MSSSRRYLSGTEVGLGRNAGSTAQRRYAPSPENNYDETTYRWVERWTAYGEALDAIRTAILKGREPWDALGDPDLLIHTEVVESGRADHRERGKWFHEQLVKGVTSAFQNLESLTSEYLLAADSVEAIKSCYCFATSPDPVDTFIHLNGSTAGSPKADVRKTMLDRTWLSGLEKGDRFPTNAAEGLRLLTDALDKKFRLFFRKTLAHPHVPTDGLYNLLPDAPHLEERFNEATAKLIEHRKKTSRLGYESGIDEHGRTELYRRALEVLEPRIAQRKSMLILGPTSSGKSHISMIAVAHAVQQRPGSNCIVLLPTKALVNQVVADWKRLLAGTEYAHWEVLAGSRDYPQFDEPLRRGRFHIAVMIPEKLLGLMANGMRLGRCNLIVADELQTIIDEQRGIKLQRLLSSIRKNHPSIPVMGISASLHKDTQARIVEWLGIDREGVLEATYRPVPLEVSAFDSIQMITRSISGLQEDTSSEDLQRKVAEWLRLPFVRAKKAFSNVLTEYGAAVAMAVEMMLPGATGTAESPDTKKRPRDAQVLFFARTRDHAEKLAEVVRVIVKLHMMKDHGRTLKSRGSPYEGFFSPESMASDIDRRTQEYLRLPISAGRTDLGESLRTGVGYHNARLEPSMRELMEDGFRSGFIRLLFATETLKLGINLPADVVVIGTMVTPEGQSQRLMTIDSAIQKMGRAGRLGFGSIGRSYLLVPARISESVQIDEKTLEGLSGQLGSLANETQRSRALRAAKDLPSVFGYYLSTTDWLTQGAHYEPRIGTALEWVAEHMLQDRAARAGSYTREDYIAQAQDVYESTLDHRFTQAKIDGKAIFDRLIQSKLLGESFRDSEKYQLTGLGRSVSVNGLPISDAGLIQEMAQALEDGAGSLTLLWLAVTSNFVRNANSWIEVNRGDVAEPDQQNLERQILHLAGEVSRLQDLTVREGGDVVGHGSAADELRGILERNSIPARYQTLGADLHTDVLRAALLVSWAQGVPFTKIVKDIVQSRLTVHFVLKSEREALTVPVHESDLRSLAENTAYLLNAASDLLTIRPSGNAYRRLQSLAQAVEVGLPSGLHELARLNLRSTHRERLAFLVDHLAEKVDDPTEIVRARMVDTAPLANPSYEEREERSTRYISEEDFEEICARLDEQRKRSAQAGHVLSDAARAQNVPGGQTYGQLNDDILMFLEIEYSAGVVQLLVEPFEALGLTFSALDEGFTLTSRVDPDLTLRFSVEPRAVGFARLDDAEGKMDVLISAEGMTSGAAASPSASESSPVVIEPSTLLELLYGVQMEVGRDPSISGQGEGAAWIQVGHSFLELLRHNQPLMRGKDVFSRLLGLVVAEPPAIKPGAFRVAEHKADI